MKFTVNAKKESDTKYAKQLETIINSKFDDSIINDILKDISMNETHAIYITVDTPMGAHIKLNDMYAFIPILEYDDSRHKAIMASDAEIEQLKEPELMKFDIPEIETTKENHPHGWYRKFEKKRY